MVIEYGGVDGEPPEPIYFRTEYYPAGMVFPPKRQVWGELNYALQGVAEITVEGVRYLSPPQYAIWIPPDAEHDASNRRDIRYVTTYVARDLCHDLPQKPCMLELGPLLKAIHADFAERGIRHPRTEEDLRLAMVIVDRIRSARRFDHYLPVSDDPLVAPILLQLQENPGDRRSLAEFGRLVGKTERTLSRRFQERLGMSFNDWRQRLRVLAALSLLEDGHSVQAISRRLGYGNPSAFIAMFRRLTGTSPKAGRAGL
ncbi:helix-turn-helix transcriptional regulator [Ciceribacter sp. L1K23]|uniref:AraC family transcriptional regulator n=1 Tax=Ciceribacter sp. L1K23 TaxID=2820276 RepID=UPI001B82B298|nr:helix-turn-helix transcriptional regulator [Ciceribacter sp. L1K23]MBR0556297.1 helix-turn-helix transcriptional regulator [Ciceribacter sp. L1K23]